MLPETKKIKETPFWQKHILTRNPEKLKYELLGKFDRLVINHSEIPELGVDGWGDVIHITSISDKLKIRSGCKLPDNFSRYLKGFDYLKNEWLMENFYYVDSTQDQDIFVIKGSEDIILNFTFNFNPVDDTEDGVASRKKNKLTYEEGYAHVEIISGPLSTDMKMVSDELEPYIFVDDVEDVKSAHMVVQRSTGFALLDNPVKPFDINFDDHYNDDINDFNEHMRAWDEHTTPNKRLCIFYGPAGTGKTNWIKNYIQQTNRKSIYIPPSMSHMITDASFIDFMLSHKGSLIIMEDAENVLARREDITNNQTSNILNLTDGMMADFLDLRIIATHNKDKSWIDTALRRPGRCYCEHEFRKLTPDKSKSLCEKLGSPYEGGELSVSEVFNSEEYGQDDSPTTDGGFMGFNT